MAGGASQFLRRKWKGRYSNVFQGPYISLFRQCLYINFWVILNIVAFGRMMTNLRATYRRKPEASTSSILRLCRPDPSWGAGSGSGSACTRTLGRSGGFQLSKLPTKRKAQPVGTCSNVCKRCSLSTKNSNYNTAETWMSAPRPKTESLETE